MVEEKEMRENLLTGGGGLSVKRSSDEGRKESGEKTGTYSAKGIQLLKKKKKILKKKMRRHPGKFDETQS